MKTIKQFFYIILSWWIICAYTPLTANLVVDMLTKSFIQAGMVAYVCIYYVAFRYGSQFWRILDHELLHSFASILCLKPVRQLHADHLAGGHINYSGTSNIFISLAPYIIWRLPVILTTTFVCTIQHILVLKFVLFALGLALAYAVIAIIEEAKPHQTDLIQHGLLCSYSYILAMNIVIAGFFADITVHHQLNNHFITQGVTQIVAMIKQIKTVFL